MHMTTRCALGGFAVSVRYRSRTLSDWAATAELAKAIRFALICELAGN